ncbi:hypothetical protein RHSIM_Rhsim05G0202600 [Rhododendron simsii]|uniref:NusG-like N-terminal domain-containing protein n=1 Tax=Rhododendron simsii TaxID=118357 RepID=A0A834H010_RHOSS|nr:hypothetical protein RHSIM_Rhsim05G0202600 [Rhododendron simsii]
MHNGHLAWSPHLHLLSLPTPLSLPPKRLIPVSAAVESSVNEQSLLTARERRQLRNERRESKPGTNWKEEVENMLAEKPKEKKVPWREKLNLDKLALLGPQWWIVRVSRGSAEYISGVLARSLARKFPDVDFKVYFPSVNETRKLKNGSLSVKSKALYPGSVFLRCVLNTEIHDFVRDYRGVGGFVANKVGNTKMQINKPKPLPAVEMEAIFRQEKEEQEKADEAFKEEQQREETLNPEKMNLTLQVSLRNLIIRQKGSKVKYQILVTEVIGLHSSIFVYLLTSWGMYISVVFRNCQETDLVFEIDFLQATVGLALFGKQTLVDLDVNEIVLETK